MSTDTRHETKLDWPGLLEAALRIPGSTGTTYRRLYNYSLGNLAFLMYQGVTPQPVATFNRWKDVDRHVKRGAKAKAIIRPINIVLKDEHDDQGNPKVLQRFKIVNAVFPICDTEGEPLPAIEVPSWSKTRALGELAVTEVPFEQFNGNMQGYAFDRNIAINPAAKYPIRTTFHELSHIVLGHTLPQTMENYEPLRGALEYEAEASGFLALNETGLITDEMATVSRGYMQGWLGDLVPTEKTVRGIFKSADTIVNAGRPLSATTGGAE